ncbi:hypothetical protein DV113_005143 [Geotrichum candidum]|uniref:Similar to Saccharomyces cerevisiae YBR056W Putative glycoside hydrolase of the mitochondrial intermembrane space n=1 Tax=Geotrichum candidum TaxID=1173061 RepID=A0A0J9XEP7_GEOCN|nr:hypothetical protein DV452_001394 [Geotrichum candidum]KAF7496824.1 hypothetical protein DV113_005143 [Geotrichum candidum]KAI8131547.1 hypothetical protein DUD61_004787 [Geotrichum candidum]KAI9210038.1 hypothetical protein DS838_005079 [Geotrichum bryndzae]CDO55712.1 similar to Saccharomyces cerevisiae YBR056W Putative glycoside hydrolase of the mitochondrial intermembrane space [Geotrichum candidum]
MGKFEDYNDLSADPVAADPPYTPGDDFTTREFFQSRLNRGVNIGSWFVLEKWITPSMFPDDGDDSRTTELDSVQIAVDHYSGDIEAVRGRFEEHWREWITDDDWSWLKEVGVTSIRVPIGYWIVDNAAYTEGTPFEEFAEVYENAWDIFKEQVLDKASDYAIGVLVDLHGLPGNANTDELWSSDDHKLKTINVLDFLADDLSGYDHVVGLQICNNAQYENQDEEVQKKFYFKAINAIRDVNQNIPIVISDGSDLHRWVDIIRDTEAQLSEEAGENVSLGVLVDTHPFRCYSDEDKDRSPREIIESVNDTIPDTDKQVDIIVGEFTTVLSSESWDRNGDEDHDDVVRDFGNAQTAHFSDRAAGFYYWTYKFGYGGAGDWCFREVMEKGAVNSAFGAAADRFPGDREPDSDYYENEFNERFNASFEEHVNYWTEQDPDRDFEHWRYEDGWRQGWSDAQAFDGFWHSELGRKAAFKKARYDEYIKEKGEGDDVMFAWRQAYDRGLQAFLDARWKAFHE